MILKTEIEFADNAQAYSVRVDISLLLRYWDGEDCEPGADLEAAWRRVQRADRALTREMLPVVGIDCLLAMARKIHVSFKRKMAAIQAEREWRSFPDVLVSTASAWASLAALCWSRATFAHVRYAYHLGTINFYSR